MAFCFFLLLTATLAKTRRNPQQTATPNGLAHSLADMPVSFTAEADKVYQLRASSVEKTFKQSMSLALSGGYFGWTAWIVVTETEAVVGGIPRETPLRWHEK